MAGEGRTFDVWFGFDSGGDPFRALYSRRIRLINGPLDLGRFARAALNGGRVQPRGLSTSQRQSSPSRRVRIRPRNPQDARKLINPGAIWNEKAKAQAPRATRTGEQPGWRATPGIRGAISRSVPADAGILDSAGFWIWRDFEQQRVERSWRNRNILATGRRGASATRPIQPTAVPGRRGDAATRHPDSASAPSPAARPVAQPAAKPDRGTSPAVAGMPETRSGTAQLPRTLPDRAADIFAESVRALGQQAGLMLNQSLAPLPAFAPARAFARTPPRDLPPVRIRGVPGMPVIGDPVAGGAPPGEPPGLTPQRNPGLALAAAVGLSTLASQKRPECNCPETKTKTKDKEGHPCSNPLISRSVNKTTGVITIKRKLQCLPSKLKSLLPRTPRTQTSWPGLPSNIPGAGSFSPWG